MTGFLAHHGAHILVLGGPVVLLAGLFAALELTRPDRPSRSPGASTRLLALAWAAVATVHLAVIREHFEEAAVLGAFFFSLSLAQYAYALAVILRSSDRLLLVGLVTNMAVVLLWAYTRAVAVPFGLGPREPAGAADLAATALELCTVIQTWVVLRRRTAGAGQDDVRAEGLADLGAATP